LFEETLRNKGLFLCPFLYRNLNEFLYLCMTKQEVLEELKKAGQIDSSRKSPLWLEAFKLYNEAHPQGKKNPSCGSCFNRVREWLRS
jgi:hypothetical protein